MKNNQEILRQENHLLDGSLDVQNPKILDFLNNFVEGKKNLAHLRQKFNLIENFVKSTSEPENSNITNLKPKEMLKDKVKLPMDASFVVYDEENGVCCFITKDEKFLQPYYELRHKIHREENGWTKYNGLAEKDDESSHVAVLLDSDNKVIGGCRIMISRNPSEILSNEISDGGFYYKKVFDLCETEVQYPYSEASRLVVSKEYRRSNPLNLMLEIFAGISVKSGCKYGFGISEMSCARDFRIKSMKLGHKCKILESFPWKKIEVCNYEQMFPIFVEFDKNVITV